MMNYQRALAAHVRMINKVGETITLRRGTDESTAKARIIGGKMDIGEDQIADNLQQRRRRAIVLASDLAAGDVTLPPMRGDEVEDASGLIMMVEHVNDESRRVEGQVVAYELMLVGA